MKKGQSLIELLLVIGLAALLLPTIITGFVTSRQGKPQQQQRLAASALLKEAGDAVRSVRDIGGWNALPATGTTIYYHHINGSGAWELIAASDQTNGQTIGGFLEKIIVKAVKRKSGAIDPTGTDDPSTKEFDITISWSQPYSSSSTTTFYLTRQENIASFDTTTENTQFGGGVPLGVAVVSQPGPTPFDGQVEIGHGGQGDWCNPILNDTSNYKMLLSGNSTTTAIWATPSAQVGSGNNIAGVVTGNDTSSSDSFTPIMVSDSQPPSPSLGTTYAHYKASGIFGDLTYAYLAVTSPANTQASIIRVSDSTEVASINNGDQTQSHSIYVDGTRLYFTSGKNGPDYLYAYDISNINSPSRLGSSSNRTLLHGAGKKMYVINNTAYIVTDSTTNQLDIVNVSNPSSLPANPNSTVNLGNDQPGVDLYVNSTATRAYIATHVTSSNQTDSAHSDYFIVNLSDNSLWGHYNTYPMNPTGVTKVPGNIGIIVGQKNSGNPYQVVSLITEASGNPLLGTCGTGLPSATFDINGLFSFSEKDGDAYSYIITNENSTPTFRIIPGGPGGGIGNGGTFTSRAFVPGGANSTAFNKFVVNYSQPAGTSLTFRVASANVGSDSTCATANYSFIGPNLNATPFPTPTGTLSSTVNVAYPIPLGTASPYVNPGYCFKYEATFNNNGDTTSTPVLYDFTLNYSP